jgi:hypothetical protein
LQRFLEEARALARFEDAPSVVRVHDYLQANGTAYMVMALIEGTSLHALYRSEAPLAEARLKAIALPLLDGLQHVHRAGFLHRDIKPSNILIRPNGQPVLIDFGAARQALGGKSRSLTSIFTPGYAPFEQYSSTGRQGPWTDIYALAATLYHGVAGLPPPQATDRVRDDPMTPAATIGAGRYSKSFLAAIDHALDVTEADRPQDVVQWRRMLNGEIPVPSPRPRVERAQAQMRAPLRRRLMPLLIGAAVVMIVAGIGGAMLPPGMLAGIAPFLSSETGEQRAVRLAEQARLATDEARAAQQAVDAEAKRRAEEEARLRTEAEARLAAQEDARRQAADAQRRIEAAARARDDTARQQAEAEARKLAEEQAARQRQIDDLVAARLAAEEARKKAEVELAEAQRQAAEAQKQADALRLQAVAARASADAEAKKQAEAEARKTVEDEIKRKAADEAKVKAEAEAKTKADAARKAEAEAKAKTDAAAKKKAEDETKAKVEAEAKRKAEAEAKASQAKAREEEEARQKAAQLAAAPAAPAYAYAGSWTWSISCPDVGRDVMFAYWHFEKIEGDTFNWSWPDRAPGTVTGRITGNRATFTQHWVSLDKYHYRASFSLTATNNQLFTGGGIVSGFPGGARDRVCSIRLTRAF